HDIDNFFFADNCLRWLLRGPDDAPRTHVLFVVDGQVTRSFDVSLKPPLPPIPLPTVQLVNQLVSGVEREGLVFRILQDHVDVRRVAGITSIGLTILLMVYGIKKLTEQRYHAETRSVLL